MLARPRGGPHRQTDLRRSISASYYAVFHTVLIAAADMVAGRGKRAEPVYNLVYRSIDHRALSGLCNSVARAPLPSKYRGYWAGDAFGHSLQAFARRLPDLQQERHAADYDPGRRLVATEAIGMMLLARETIQNWAAAQEEERAVFLFLLLFPPR